MCTTKLYLPVSVMTSGMAEVKQVDGQVITLKGSHKVVLVATVFNEYSEQCYVPKKLSGKYG